MIVIDISLSDIPESARKTGKNGKVYTQIVIDEKKQIDDYGNSHAVYMNQSKEEREAKTPKVYIGNGKEFKFNGGSNNSQKQEQKKSSSNLPF